MTTSSLKIVEHRRGWCTVTLPHEPHPYQELDKSGEYTPRWVDLWCSGGTPPSDDEKDQLVVVLYNDDCWCQDPERLAARTSAAIGHVLDKVREIVEEFKVTDTWIDRWDVEQSYEVVDVLKLSAALDLMQHGEEEEIEDDDDDA